MIFVSGGCSFSECISPWVETWPKHLQQYLNCKHYSTAMGSQGNSLIMRQILYKCNELLKTNKPEDLLVGIMWSGPNRFDFYSQKKYEFANTFGWMKNPLNFIPHDEGNWIILNQWWDFKFSKIYYNIFYDQIYSQIQTLEYILHTQWFMEKNNINYFMMSYMNEVLNLENKNHPQLKWLFEQIDFTKFVSKNGCMEWCRDTCSIKKSYTEGESEFNFHPSSLQHGEYTHKVIIPFLEKNNLISL